MKFRSIGGLLLVTGLPLFFGACSKDDEKPKAAGVTFELAEEKVFESDGTIESFHPQFTSSGTGREVQIKIKLDRAAAQQSEIEYSIEGSATRNTTTKIGDFDVEGDDEIITIEKGATEAVITLT
jgi:hypothetical protein